MGNLLRDFHYALRALRKSPGFATAALLILALGIGANTAIFSVINAALLQPLPFGDPSRLVRLWHTPPAKSFPGMSTFPLSPANFLDWRQQSHGFSHAAIFSYISFILSGNGDPQPVAASRVSTDFFPMLQVQPLLGRTFTPDEDQVGREREVVLSYPFWRSHFAGDTNIVGQTIALNDESYTVVGVMGPTFRFPFFAKAWTPMAFTDKERVVRGEHHYMAIARLKPGVTVQQAQAELDAISRRLEQQYPQDDRGWGALVLPLQADMVGNLKPTLLILLGAVGFVLLIACANVTNLFLAKMLSRKREIAIRTALGANRRRLLQQSLCETVVLALLGAVLGVAIANYGVDFITKFLGNRLPPSVQVHLDGSVLGFTLAIAVATGLLAGLVPGWRLANTDVNEALKQGAGRTGSDSGGTHTRSVLVVAEVALSLVLMVGAGLMIRTLWALHQVDTGCDAKNVETMSLSVPPTKYAGPAEESTALNQILNRLRALPGVTAAAGTDALPLQGGSTQPIAIAGRPVQALADQPEVAVRVTTPGYLKTLQVPLLRGRDISESDSANGPQVVLISESMAKRFWPSQDPIGQHLTLSFFPGITRAVVGIVGDVKIAGLDQAQPIATIYYPLAQLTTPPSVDWRAFGFTLAVRTSGDPAAMGPTIVKAIHEVDASVPVVDVQPMEAIVNDSLTQPRLTMMLLAGFAGLALLLAAVGIHSVLAYSVRRRVREIGIRMALGAQIDDVLRMVVIDGLKPTLVGVAIGTAGSLALGSVLTKVVFGVSTQDVPTFLTVTLVLIVVGVAASVAPAWRAAQVQPVEILHDE
jgi:putative ABC transport system permease protein